jgi:hypothetical protein
VYGNGQPLGREWKPDNLFGAWRYGYHCRQAIRDCKPSLAMHIHDTLTAMLAHKCRSWPTISYVVVSILNNHSYNYFLVVHANGVIHGHLVAVSLLPSRSFRACLYIKSRQMYSSMVMALLASPTMVFPRCIQKLRAYRQPLGLRQPKAATFDVRPLNC